MVTYIFKYLIFMDDRLLINFIMMINKKHETFQFTQLNNNINRLSAKTKNSVLNIVLRRGY
jgi:hypothetical protein